MMAQSPMFFADVGSDCCDARMINGGTQCENCGSDGIIARTPADLRQDLLAAAALVICVGLLGLVLYLAH